MVFCKTPLLLILVLLYDFIVGATLSVPVPGYTKHTDVKFCAVVLNEKDECR